jgi:hypothetical protein
MRTATYWCYFFLAGTVDKEPTLILASLRTIGLAILYRVGHTISIITVTLTFMTGTELAGVLQLGPEYSGRKTCNNEDGCMKRSRFPFQCTS